MNIVHEQVLEVFLKARQTALSKILDVQKQGQLIDITTAFESLKEALQLLQVLSLSTPLRASPTSHTAASVSEVPAAGRLAAHCTVDHFYCISAWRVCK